MQIKQLKDIKARQTQLPGLAVRNVKNVIVVGSGKGGVGKSTVTVNLAAALVRMGAKVGVLDADIYGPSMPLMLPQTRDVEVVDAQYLPPVVHGVQVMSIGYLTQTDSPLIWRGPMLAKALLQMLDMTRWDNLDYLFVDLPPGTGDIQLSLVQKIPLAGGIIVTTPQLVATVDAEKALLMLKKTQVAVLGIIENMSVHHCAHCGHAEDIFGEGGAKRLASQYQVPILGRLPLAQAVRHDSDSGLPTALKNDAISQEFFSAAYNMATTLAERPQNYADRFPPVTVR